MTLDRSFIERSKGAALIVALCEDLVDDLDIELSKPPYWVHPIVDNITVSETSDLILQTKSGSTKIRFSREELADYPGAVGTYTVEAKIMEAIQRIIPRP